MAVIRAQLDGPDGVDALPPVRLAESDAEWLALIEEAKNFRANPLSTWPEPVVPTGVRILRSCSDVPPGVTQTQMAIEYSPDETKRRVIFSYGPPATHLILYSDSDMTGCEQRIVDIVTGPDAHKQAVDQHLCDEMARQSQGLPLTDETLRPASPTVAVAYLAAFCE